MADLMAQLPTIPPAITRVTPPGMRRGSSVVLMIEGRSLAGAQSVLFDAAGLTGTILSVKDLAEEVRPIRIGVDLGARVVQGKKQEAELEVKAAADVEPGIHWFRVQTPLGTSNLAALDVGTLPEVKEKEPKDSPGQGQLVVLPATLTGTLDRPGDVDTFQFDGRAGEDVVFEPTSSSLGSDLESVLVLRDAAGGELARAGDYTRRTESVLTFKLPADGKYTISISDLERRGGSGFFYRLNSGALPYVREVFPLGVRSGQSSEVAVKGSNLGDVRTMKVEAPARAEGWQTVSLRVKTPQGESLNKMKLAVGNEPEVMEREPNDSVAEAQPITIPASINGHIAKGKPGAPADEDYFRFQAKKGRHLVVEVAAARLGSPLDSLVEVLDAHGREIPQATARAVVETTLVLADRSSKTPDIRLASVTGINVNDYLMMGDELDQLIFVPDQPDIDLLVKNYAGQRLPLFNTSPQAHPSGSSVYKVRLFKPGEEFPPNGLPVFHLTLRNDDGGPGFGQDSRLDFTAPQDGEYVLHIKDVRGLEGEDFAYRLTVREATPDFVLTARPSNPNLPRGGRVPLRVTANRTLGYDGPIDIEVKGLPPSVTASAATILPGQDSTVVLLKASEDAPAKATAATPFQVVGRGKVDGRELVRVADADGPLRVVSLMPPADLVVTAEPKEIVLEPGKTAPLTLHCDRKNGFEGRVPYEIANLPPGVVVADIGFTGGFVNKEETSRTIYLRAEEWAQPISQPIYVLGTVESNASTQHASVPIPLKVFAKKVMAQAGEASAAPNR